MLFSENILRSKQMLFVCVSTDTSERKQNSHGWRNELISTLLQVKYTVITVERNYYIRWALNVEADGEESVIAVL